MPVPAKKALQNSTSNLALNVMRLRRQAEKTINCIFLPAHPIFPTSYHNRYFKYRELIELIDIAEEISNEGVTLYGVAQKLKEGSYTIYATSSSTPSTRQSRREISASPADIEQLEAEAAMYMAHGQLQFDLLIKAYGAALQAAYEALAYK